MSIYENGLDEIVGAGAADWLSLIPVVGQIFFPQLGMQGGMQPGSPQYQQYQAQLQQQQMAQQQAMLAAQQAAQQQAERQKFWQTLAVGGVLIGAGIVAWKVLSPRPAAPAPSGG